MPVDPNDLLIFKMRGMKAKLMKLEKKARAQAPEREPVQEVAPQPAPQPVQQIPVQKEVPAAKPQRLPLTKTITALENRIISYRQAHEEERRRKKEQQTPAAPAEPAKQRSEEQIARETFAVTRERAKPEEELPIEESRQFYGYEPQGREEVQPIVTQGQRKKLGGTRTNFFAGMTGFLFLLNAAIFSYYIYPQSLFIVNYIYSAGIIKFLMSYNTGYYFSFLNTVLALLSFMGGLLMFIRQEKGHLFSGVAGAMVILTVTYEYMQSNLVYLLVVSTIAFISIGTLTYARMSAASMVEEREELTPEEIDWPRIETF